jgi:hypothetical protein
VGYEGLVAKKMKGEKNHPYRNVVPATMIGQSSIENTCKSGALADMKETKLCSFLV